MLKIGCVIPCYKGSSQTLEVVQGALRHADLVVVVDDRCPYNTGKQLQARLEHEERFSVLFNEFNAGVGASTIKGLRFLISEGCKIVVKIDADGQMNPDLIQDLIRPIKEGYCDACKGNRFSSIDHVLSMPKIRILGNLLLSFISKLSTGYWELFDPTNGFLAFQSSALRRVRLDKVDDRYFFESDLLFQCGLAQITFAQLHMESVYRGEESSLNPMREVRRFAGKHLINFFRRIFYQYFLLDFNAGSIEIILGSMSALIVFLFAVRLLLAGVLNSRLATPGESSLFAITTIIMVQMFLSFLYFDSTQQPLLRTLRKRLMHGVPLDRPD